LADDPWADPRLIVPVLSNEDLNQVTWEHRAMEGNPRFEASQEIPHVDLAEYARLIGLRGIKVTESSQIEDAWTEAFASDRPVIVDAITTPDEPPIPPHVTFEQAEALLTSTVGDPEAGWRGALEGFREMIHEFVGGPRRPFPWQPSSTPPTVSSGSTSTPEAWPGSREDGALPPITCPWAPIAAPGLMTLVGGMGVLAALLRRED